MSAAFAWLNDLMTWLGRWVPRIVLVRASHVGVRFGRGGAMVPLRPGLHIYWPIFMEVQLVSMAIRTIETSAQVNDGQLVSAVVVYRIVDAVRVLRDVYDVRSQIDMRTKATLVAKRPFDPLRPNMTELELLQREFKPLGVAIDGLAVTQRSWCLPLKNLSDWASHEDAKLE